MMVGAQTRKFARPMIKKVAMVLNKASGTWFSNQMPTIAQLAQETIKIQNKRSVVCSIIF